MTTRSQVEAVAGIVVVHYDDNGEISYHVYGDDRVRLLIVDERAPEDRVYEWLPREARDGFREMVPQGATIGSSQDARHPAIKARVESFIEGRPHLSIVDTPSHD